MITARGTEGDGQGRRGGTTGGGGGRPRGGSWSQQRPSQRTRRTDPARLAAFEVLRAVDADDAYANLVLPRRLRAHHLAGRDAAFATELAYGTLRRLGSYDAVLAACLDRAPGDLDPPVLDVLRLGAHQLLATRVPAHAAVSQTVALARETVGAGAGALVNAVLRRLSERDLTAWLDEVAPARADDLTGHLAVVHSHPPWVVRALHGALVTAGRDAGELADLLAADNEPAPVTLVALSGLVDPARLAGTSAGRWSPLAALLDGGDPGALPEVREGRARVQDEGSQLAVLALLAAETGGPGTDTRWADLAAGPGGKTAVLGAEATRRGATVLAVEVTPHRAELVRGSVAAVEAARPGTVTVRTGDGRTLGEDQPGGFDRVLVDAPCTGLGALRRRPEARWRRSPADLAALAPLQRDLLASALDAVRPGGVVAYVTCSPHPVETLTVVTDVLRRRDDVERLDTPALLAGVATGDRGQAGGQAGDGGLAGDGPQRTRYPDGTSAQLWPHAHGTDAMFVAVLRRH